VTLSAEVIVIVSERRGLRLRSVGSIKHPMGDGIARDGDARVELEAGPRASRNNG